MQSNQLEAIISPQGDSPMEDHSHDLSAWEGEGGAPVEPSWG